MTNRLDAVQCTAPKEHRGQPGEDYCQSGSTRHLFSATHSYLPLQCISNRAQRHKNLTTLSGKSTEVMIART